MRARKKLCLVLLASLTAQSLLAKSIFTYRVDWFNSSESDCPREALVVAEAFSRSTGLQVMSATCEKPFPWKQDLVVQYLAEGKASLVSTFSEFALEQGIYVDQKSCESELLREKALFLQETGLEPVAAFCYSKPERTDHKYRYISRIDGFGNPRLRPFVFTHTIHEYSDTNQETLETMLGDSLGQLSSIVSPRIRVDLAGGNTRITIKYYALRKQPLVFDVFSASESLGICYGQKAAIDSLVEQFGMVAPVSICSHQESIDVANQYIFGFTAGPYSLTRWPVSYKSRAECTASIPKIIANLRSETGSSQVEGFCSFEKVEIFSDYSYFVKVLTTI